MAQSSDAVPFETDDEQVESQTPDSTCPECGTESVISYIDRYSGYEYCTSCDWSDEDADDSSTREPITRRDRESRAS